MNSTVIWFVRHGEIKNPAGVIPGRLPGFGLSNKGKKQASRTAQFLKDKKITAIYSSPQQRCLETAMAIAKFFPSTQIMKEKLVDEGSIGWDGRKKKEIVRSGLWQTYLEKPSRIKGEENFMDVARGAKEFVLKVLKRHQGEQIVCVTHKDVIRSVRLLLEGKSIDLLNRIDCAKASVTQFVFSGFKLSRIECFDPNVEVAIETRYNDIYHLSK